MRKTTKSLLLTSLFLFCAGLLLTLGSFLFVKIANVDPYGMEHKTKAIEDKTITLTEILSASPNANFVKKLSLTEFTKLDVLNFVGEVNVCTTTEETHLSVQSTDLNNFSCEIVGDTLSIKELEPVGFFGLYVSADGFSFHGLRQIFGAGLTANTGKVVTLYLNENTKLNQITVDSKNGNVNLNGAYAEAIQVTSANGNISLQGLSCDSSKITLTGSRTSVTVSDCRFAILNASVKVGSISAKLLDSAAQSVILDTIFGNVNVLCDLPTTHYKLTLSTMVGAVERNGEVAGKELSSPTHTQNRISSTVILGNISVQYNGTDEATYAPAVSDPLPPDNETTEEAVTEEAVTEEAETTA